MGIFLWNGQGRRPSKPIMLLKQKCVRQLDNGKETKVLPPKKTLDNLFGVKNEFLKSMP